MFIGSLRKLRQILPVEAEYELRNACVSVVPIRHRSRHDVVFHTCVWKTASQWVRLVLSDPRIYMYSGLKTHIPIPTEVWWPDPDRLVISERRIVPGLYCTYQQFASVRKPPRHAVFFVQRDPRDVLVSWYFSNRYSHPSMCSIDSARRALAQMSEREGIIASIDHFDEIAWMLRSWARAAKIDTGIRIVRYEDITGPDSLQEWAGLLAHCDIAVPTDVLGRILDTYAFSKISGGRKPGEVDASHKYRRGLPGDWKNHFDAEISERFCDRYGDLLRQLGYA
ncbi:MAG: sulfotransferase domain-containing protein [Rhodospirillales bacterium]|nr:sulfotransferase domain-containing protein [Rhodospirillales bacterium]